MSLDDYFGIGRTDILGSHHFTAGEIKEFAREFDPAPFHIDEEAARSSVFGALCASGWHTVSLWMHYNVARPHRHFAAPWQGPGPEPVFGPSPGIRDLRWPRPVFAGDVITYRRTGMSWRPHRRRPGWVVVEIRADAENADGALVLECFNTVLVRTE